MFRALFVKFTDRIDPVSCPSWILMDTHRLLETEQPGIFS